MEVKSIYPIINFSDEDEIAVQYERLGADGVIIISPDFSDEAMLIKKIRNICEKSDCRLYIWQPYRRLEDIKKVLYAGAAGAWIEATEQTLIREAADRFGADRVGMVISEPKLAADEFKLAKELNLTNIFVTGTIEISDTIVISDSRNVSIAAAENGTVIKRADGFLDDMFMVQGENTAFQFGTGKNWGYSFIFDRRCLFRR